MLLTRSGRFITVRQNENIRKSHQYISEIFTIVCIRPTLKQKNDYIFKIGYINKRVELTPIPNWQKVLLTMAKTY